MSDNENPIPTTFGVYGQAASIGVAAAYNTEYGLGLQVFVGASVGVSMSYWHGWYYSLEHGWVNTGEAYVGVGTPSGTSLNGVVFTAEKGLASGSEFATFGLGVETLFEAGILVEGDIPLDRDWGPVYLEDFETGADGYTYNRDFFEEEIYRFQNGILPECFLAGTLVSMWDGCTKKIEDIVAGDLVLSHDHSGIPVRGRVSQIFRNTSEEIFRINGDLLVTGGHRFKQPDGSFDTIGSILTKGGEFVLADGRAIPAVGERITEAAELSSHQIVGNLALSTHQTCWKTYNFEVEQYHTYVANGIQVHNDSTEFDRGVPITAYRLSEGVFYERSTKGGRDAYRLSFDDNLDGITDRQEFGVGGDDVIVKTFVEFDENGNLKSEPDFEIEYKADTVITGGQIGSILGSTLGQSLVGDNILVQIAAGSALAAVLSNIGDTLHQYFDVGGGEFFYDSELSLGDIAGQNFETFGEDLFTEIKSAGIGALSSFLAEELGEAIGLDGGFEGQLFQTVTSRTIGTVLNTTVDNIANGATGIDVFNGLGTNLTTGIANGVGSFIGSYLAREIYTAETTAGAIGGSIGGAIGSAIGAGLASVAIGSLGVAVGSIAGVALNFILPGVGAFIGVLLGSLIGDLFGSEDHPEASSEQHIYFSSGRYVRGDTDQNDGGSLELARAMGERAGAILNGYFDLIGGLNVNSVSPSILLGHEEDEFYGQVRNADGTWTGQFDATVDGAIDKTVLEALKRIEIQGGNIYLKRAIANSEAETLTDLAGDLQIAEDFARYLEDKSVIDTLIAADPNSAFAAGWLITLLRAEELGLTTWQQSDFYGGFEGFLHSLDIASRGLTPHDVSVTLDTGAMILTYDEEVLVDGVLQTQTVTLATIDDYAVLGFSVTATETSFDGATHFFTGTEGRDIWYAPDGQQNQFDEPGDIHTEGSDDILIGGDGADTINAGTGWDFVRGGDGDDTINGGAGNDWIDGGGGNDVIVGDDAAFSTAGAVPINGDTNDGTGRDWFGVEPAAAPASLPYPTGSFVIRHPEGDDTIYGGEGDDTITGLGGSDRLHGDAGADQIFGGEGDDLLAGGAGADTLDGGAGYDAASYADQAAGVTVNLTTGAAGDGDTLTGIEDLIGSDHADTLTGDGGDNIIDGGLGDDVIDGAGGVDTVSYHGAAQAVTVDLVAGTATREVGTTTDVNGDPVPVIETDTLSNIESATGTAFGDHLAGAAAGGTLIGGAGDDTFEIVNDDVAVAGGAGATRVVGGDGFDTLSLENAASGMTVDVRDDGDGNTFSGIEQVIGSAHDDTVKTNDDGQLIEGGGGADVLEGGGGDDVYVYERGDGADTIADYAATHTATGVVQSINQQHAITDIYGFREGGIDSIVLGDGFAFRHVFGGLAGGTTALALAAEYGEAGPNVIEDDPGTSVLDNVHLTLAFKTDAALYENTLSEIADRITIQFGGEVPVGALEVTHDGADTHVQVTPDFNILTDYTYDEGIRFEFDAGATDIEILGFQDAGFIRIPGVTRFVNGTAGADAGASAVNAADGNGAWLFGGAGNDELNGGAGGDVLVGDTGNDLAAGGDGGDQYTYWHGDGDDIITDTGGIDALVFGGGITRQHVELQFGVLGVATDPASFQVLDASDPAAFDLRLQVLDVDALDGTVPAVTGSVVIRGYAAADTMIEEFRFAGGEVLKSWDLTQIYAGSAYDDTIQGTSAADIIAGGDGADLIRGGDGNDIVKGGAGADVIDGGLGKDLVSYADSASAVTIDLSLSDAGQVSASGTGDEQGDEIYNTEGIIGSQYDDTLTGNQFGNELHGGGGTDQLYGGLGDDVYVLNRGDGADTVTDLALDTVSTGQTWQPGVGRVIAKEHTVVDAGETALGFGAGIGYRHIIGSLGALQLSDVLALFGDPTGNVSEIDVGASDFSQANFTIGVKSDSDLYAQDATLVADRLLVEYGGLYSGGEFEVTNQATKVVPGPNEDTTYTYNLGDRYEAEVGLGQIGSLAFTDAASIDIGHLRHFVTGSAANDTLQAAANTATWLFGGAGNDTLTGGALGDVFVGDTGDDILTGSFGDDQYAYWYGDGDDILDDTGGRDTLVFGGGITQDRLIIRYGALSNHSDPASFADFAAESSSAMDLRFDILEPDPADGSAPGVMGSITIRDYRTGSVRIESVKFSDGTTVSISALLGVIVATEFDDILTGTSDDDVIDGAQGNDTLSGAAGNDELIGGEGADVINGDEGTDTASYESSASGVTVNLTTGAGSGGDAQGDTLSGIERIVGSEFADTLIGAAGDEVLEGRGGDDTLEGGAGADQIDGGAGSDTASYAAAAAAVTASLTTGTGTAGDAVGDSFVSIENLEGSAHADTLNGDSAANTLSGLDGDDQLFGEGGDDVLIGGGGADQLDGGLGFDTADYSGHGSAVSADLTSGLGPDADTLISIENLTGSSFDDNLVGNHLGNTLQGLAGADILSGGAGADIISGGAGNDRLEGGAGGDTYTFEIGDGDDIIDDLAGDDAIAFGAGIAAADLQLRMGVLDDPSDPASFAEPYQVDLDSTDLRIEILDPADGTTVTGSLTIQNYANPANLIEEFRFADGTIMNLSELLGAATPTAGDDFLVADVSGAALDATGGNDTLIGRDGTETLTGGSGDDVLSGGAGADVLDGGDGFDTAHYGSADAAVTVDLGSGLHAGDAAGDTLTGIEAVYGSRHDDILTASSSAVTLSGQLGNDTLIGGAGNDTLLGGGGDDHYYFSAGGGQDTISDHAVTKTVASEQEPYTVTETSQVWVNTGEGSGYWQTQTTTHTEYRTILTASETQVDGGNDTLHFGSGIAVGDVVAMLVGDDLVLALRDPANPALAADQLPNRVTITDWRNALNRVETLAFADGTIIGLSGIPALMATDGDDVVVWDLTALNIDGGIGNDTLTGAAFDDVISGGEGADTITGADGADTLNGGAGNDTIYGGAGADTVHGDDGVDSVYGGSGDDVIHGGLGNDVLRGHEGADVIQGDDGVDYLVGGAGDDHLLGGSGNDSLYGESGADTLDGGAGFDYSRYDSSPAAVTASLLTGTGTVGDAQGDTFTAIEGLIGSAYADTLTGDALGNVLFGRAGNDQLFGGDGNDNILGGAGADLVDGGGGLDYANYAQSTGGVTVNLATGTASGGYATGDTFVSIERLNGSTHDDHLTGDAGANTILGGTGNDIMIGAAGADYLRGDGGDDTLHGDGGNDTLIGNGGNDLLFGAAGNDIYRFERAWGNDTIKDYDFVIESVTTEQTTTYTDSHTVWVSSGESGYWNTYTDTHTTTETVTTDEEVQVDSGNDRLNFDGTLAAEDMWFERNGNNLVVSILGEQSDVTIQDWYTDAFSQIETFQDSGGRLLSAADVESLVSAMAAFSPNDGSDSTGVLPNALPNEIQLAVNAAWS